MASPEGFLPFEASGGRQLLVDDYVACGLSLVLGVENNECCDENQNIVKDDCSDLDPTRHLSNESNGSQLDENNGSRGKENDNSIAHDDFGRDLQTTRCGNSIVTAGNQCCSSNRNIVGRACCPDGDTPQGRAYSPAAFECCSNEFLVRLADGCPSSAPSGMPSDATVCPVSESVKCSDSKGSKKSTSGKGNTAASKGKGKGDATETSSSILICVDGETVCQDIFEDPGTFYECGPCEPLCSLDKIEPCGGKGKSKGKSKGESDAIFIQVCIEGRTVCQDSSIEPDHPYTCGSCKIAV